MAEARCDGRGTFRAGSHSAHAEGSGMVQRRDLILGAALAGLARTVSAATETAVPFDAELVRRLAQERAAKPYAAPHTALPAPFDAVDYDAYRAIRFDPNQALWHGMGLGFEAQFFHRGWLYKERVDIYEVVDGKASPITYRPELFSFGPGVAAPTTELGFAGFRLHAPINRPDYYDEVCVFLGASYFRAVGKGEGYGLSARGLSIKTGDPGGEEFPAFRAFWLERPAKGTGSIVVHALLDSPSCTAAMRFTVRPGEDTVMDMETALFPRVDLHEAGVGTGTSMFFFDSSDRVGVDDWRPGVHDSDGLLMLTGRGEQLWRQLANPTKLQISAFGDISPRGFGLVQRKRKLADFEDLEARYDRRPSLWVEPIGDWGAGAVMLLEIPTRDEVHDNIAAFWRPKAVLGAKGEIRYTCRLHWSDAPPIGSKLGQVQATRTGAGSAKGSRVFVLDIAGEALAALPAGTALRHDVTSDKGKLQNIVLIPAPELGGWRLSFELVPDADAIELHARVMNGDTPVSETWLYRWTP
jgi:glucans biosynthesis protein